MNDSSFILEQLAKARIYHVTKNGYAVLICPIHNSGLEKTPSRRVSFGDKYPYGESFCYACSGQEQKLTWNQLAAKCNMAPLPGEEDGEEGEDNQLWLSIIPPEDFYGKDAPGMTHFPWKGGWRGISAKLMRQLCATEVNSKDEPRLYLPILIDGDEVSNIQCTIDTKSEAASKIKYLKEGKVTQWALYPVDIAFPLAEKLGYILLVEGARDALNLLQYGVPAVCIFGTNGWNKAKRDTLIDLGVKVVVAMDGDEPGRKCSEKIETDMKRLKHPYKVIRFADGVDPGGLPKADVLDIADMLLGKPAPKSLNDNSVVKELLALFNKRRK